MNKPFRRHRKSSHSIIDTKFEAQKIAFAPISFQATKALRDLGILSEIENSPNGVFVSEISSKLKLTEYAISTLLEVGLSLNLVKLNLNKYLITKLGSFILHDEMTRINLNFVADVCYNPSAFLQDSIKNEKPEGLKVFGNWKTIYEGLSQLPPKVQKSWFDFDHYYSDCAFPDALEIVFKNPPKNLFDIGGNTGKWAAQCLNRDSNITVTILDLPGQLEKAKKNSALNSRVKFYEIDLLSPNSTLPNGADVIWMSQFLDCFSKAQIIDILQKCAKAISKNSVIYILEPFFDKQKFPASTFSLNHTSLYFTVLANGNSKMYSFDEMQDCINQAGLHLEEVFSEVGENDYTLLKCRKK